MPRGSRVLEIGDILRGPLDHHVIPHILGYDPPKGEGAWREYLRDSAYYFFCHPSNIFLALFPQARAFGSSLVYLTVCAGRKVYHPPYQELLPLD